MWDIDADGCARGDGVSVVILKTLSAALEDGNQIECVVREIGINHDVRTNGITMPSASAQKALGHEIYSKAGLDLSKKEDRPDYLKHGALVHPLMIQSKQRPSAAPFRSTGKI